MAESQQVSKTTWKSGGGEMVKTGSTSSTAVKYSSSAQYSSSTSKEVKESSTTTETFKRSVVTGGTSGATTSSSSGGQTREIISSSGQTSQHKEAGTASSQQALASISHSESRRESSSLKGSSSLQASATRSTERADISSGSQRDVIDYHGLGKSLDHTAVGQRAEIRMQQTSNEHQSSLASNIGASTQQKQQTDMVVTSSKPISAGVKDEKASGSSSATATYQKLDTGHGSAGHGYTTTCKDCTEWRPSLEAKKRASFDEEWKARLRSASPPSSRRGSRDIDNRKDSTSSREPSPRKGSMRRKSSLDGSFRRESTASRGSMRKGSHVADNASLDEHGRRESRNYKQIDEDWKASLRGSAPLRSPSVIRRITQQASKAENSHNEFAEDLEEQSDSEAASSTAQHGTTSKESQRVVSTKHIGRLTDKRRSSMTENTSQVDSKQSTQHQPAAERRRSSFTVDEHAQTVDSTKSEEKSEARKSKVSLESRKSSTVKVKNDQKSTGALETIASITKSSVKAAGQKIFGRKKSSENKDGQKKVPLATTQTKTSESVVSGKKTTPKVASGQKDGKQGSSGKRTIQTTTTAASASTVSTSDDFQLRKATELSLDHNALENQHSKAEGRSIQSKEEYSDDDRAHNSNQSSKRKLPKTPAHDGTKTERNTSQNLNEKDNKSSIKHNMNQTLQASSTMIETSLTHSETHNQHRFKPTAKASTDETQQTSSSATEPASRFGKTLEVLTRTNTNGSLKLLEPSLAKVVQHEISSKCEKSHFKLEETTNVSQMATEGHSATSQLESSEQNLNNFARESIESSCKGTEMRVIKEARGRASEANTEKLFLDQSNMTSKTRADNGGESVPAKGPTKTKTDGPRTHFNKGSGHQDECRDLDGAEQSISEKGTIESRTKVMEQSTTGEEHVVKQQKTSRSSSKRANIHQESTVLSNSTSFSAQASINETTGLGERGLPEKEKATTHKDQETERLDLSRAEEHRLSIRKRQSTSKEHHKAHDEKTSSAHSKLDEKWSSQQEKTSTYKGAPESSGFSRAEKQRFSFRQTESSSNQSRKANDEKTSAVDSELSKREASQLAASSKQQSSMINEAGLTEKQSRVKTVSQIPSDKKSENVASEESRSSATISSKARAGNQSQEGQAAEKAPLEKKKAEKAAKDKKKQSGNKMKSVTKKISGASELLAAAMGISTTIVKTRERNDSSETRSVPEAAVIDSQGSKNQSSSFPSGNGAQEKLQSHQEKLLSVTGSKARTSKTQKTKVEESTDASYKQAGKSPVQMDNPRIGEKIETTHVQSQKSSISHKSKTSSVENRRRPLKEAPPFKDDEHKSGEKLEAKAFDTTAGDDDHAASLTRKSDLKAAKKASLVETVATDSTDESHINSDSAQQRAEHTSSQPSHVKMTSSDETSSVTLTEISASHSSSISSSSASATATESLVEKKQGMKLPNLKQSVMRDEAKPGWQRIVQPGTRTPTSPTRSPGYATIAGFQSSRRTSVEHDHSEEGKKRLSVAKQSGELVSPSLALSLINGKTVSKKGVWEGEEDEFEVSLGSSSTRQAKDGSQAGANIKAFEMGRKESLQHEDVLNEAERTTSFESTASTAAVSVKSSSMSSTWSTRAQGSFSNVAEQSSGRTGSMSPIRRSSGAAQQQRTGSTSSSPATSRKSVPGSSDIRRESSSSVHSSTGAVDAEQQSTFVRPCGCRRKHGSRAGLFSRRESRNAMTCDVIASRSHGFEDEHSSRFHEDACAYAFRSQWCSEDQQVSTWDWRYDQQCYMISADNASRRQRYVSGMIMRPRLAPVRWSNTLIWNIDSTRQRHRSVCYFQPRAELVKYIEAVYAWSDCDEATFPEILASKGQQYFITEKTIDLSAIESPEDTHDQGATDAGQAASSSNAVKQGTEIKLGVIFIDDCKNRS